jgi:hypothetical protein
MNMLSDTKGRKFSFILSWAIANIGIGCIFQVYFKSLFWEPIQRVSP